MKVFSTNVDSKVLAHRGKRVSLWKMVWGLGKKNPSRSQSISIIFMFLLIRIAWG